MRRASPSRFVRWSAITIAAAVVACGAGTGEPREPAASADTTPAAVGSASPTTGTSYTGLLSEEAFKAIHELKADRAPAPRGQEVQVEGSTAYLSLPLDAKAPLPGVVVIHEWWGLNEHIRHWTDRLAEDGYAALAVDLYGGKVAANADDAMAAMKAVNDEGALKILRGANRFLETDPRTRSPRTGSIGWCFGGAWSLQLAMHEPALDAAVIYYGRLVTDVAALQAIRAPVLGVFGNKDGGIPPKAVDEFDKALHEAGVMHSILRYDADHAFANPSGKRYDEKAAEDAWKHVRAFLAMHLKDG
ncbi:dienelactone hydrolase family protein [Chondromyces crocatus]|nr:dienelactone hydrolase family protein [Chondromyces crocatus]